MKITKKRDTKDVLTVCTSRVTIVFFFLYHDILMSYRFVFYGIFSMNGFLDQWNLIAIFTKRSHGIALKGPCPLVIGFN